MNRLTRSVWIGLASWAGVAVLTLEMMSPIGRMQGPMSLLGIAPILYAVFVGPCLALIGLFFTAHDGVKRTCSTVQWLFGAALNLSYPIASGFYFALLSCQ